MSLKFVDGKLVKEVVETRHEELPENHREALVARQAEVINQVQALGAELKGLEAEISEVDEALASAPAVEAEEAPADPTVIPVVEG